MTPTRLEYDLDADTAVRAAMAYHLHDPAVTGLMRAGRNRTLVLLAAWLVPWLLVLVALDAPPESLAVVAALVLLALAAVGLTFRGRWRRAVEQNSRRLLADPAGQAALGRRVVEATADGLSVTTSFSRAAFPWRAVVRTLPTRDFLILVLPGPTPVAVPRAAFADAHAFDRFGDDVRERVRAAGGPP